MLPNLGTLRLDHCEIGPSNEWDPPKIYKKRKALPPGWYAKQNATGDTQYYSPDGRYNEFSIPLAHKKYQSTKDREVFTPHVPQKDCHTTESFGSVSKSLHRLRILRDMEIYECETNKAPVLVYIAAPDHTDSHFFQREIQKRPGLKGTKLIAVNTQKLDDIEPLDGGVRIECIQGTLAAVLAEKDAGFCSHLWMDTTQNDIGNREIWDARRTTVSMVYVVLSLSRHTLANTRITLSTQCDFFGLKIKHEEAYSGKNNSNSINMVFVACKVNDQVQRQAFAEQFTHIGCPLWHISYKDMKPEKKGTKLESQCYYYHDKKDQLLLGLIVGFDTRKMQWSLKMFNSGGAIDEKVVRVTHNDNLKFGPNIHGSTIEEYRRKCAS